MNKKNGNLYKKTNDLFAYRANTYISIFFLSDEFFSFL